MEGKIGELKETEKALESKHQKLLHKREALEEMDPAKQAAEQVIETVVEQIVPEDEKKKQNTERSN